MKPNLVVIPAGDKSLHPLWLISEEERNWDAVVSYYGKDPDLFRHPGIPRLDRDGTQYPAFHELVLTGRLDPWQYKRIWLPDDDLEVDGYAINRFFDLCDRHDLALAQPALTASSYASYPHTIEDRRFVLRWTNFVEVMAPCFDNAALRICFDTFRNAHSSYGLDAAWSARISGSRRMAIVDATPVRHTRPIGGPLYATLAGMGVDPHEELRRNLTEIGVDRFVPRLEGGILLDGSERDFRAGGPLFLQALRHLSRGETILAWLVRERMRGSGPRSFQVRLLDQIFHALGLPGKWHSPAATPPGI